MGRPRRRARRDVPLGRGAARRPRLLGRRLPEFLAAAFRGWNAPDERMELLGFRCAAAPGTLARKPVRRDDPPRAEKDDAGVLILSAPMELGRRSRR